MNKEFVTYKQSLALKELGYDEPAICYYNREHNLTSNISPKDWHLNLPYSVDGENIKAPLYQQAFRWFREKYGLGYVIEYHCEGYNLLVSKYYRNRYSTYEEAEQACLNKLIEICKNK